MKIKSISKKLILCLVIFLLLFNFGFASISNVDFVYAANNQNLDYNTIAEEAEEEADSLLGGVLNGLAGIFSWIVRAIVNVVSMIFQNLSYFVINTAGNTGVDSTLITPFDIFFNKFTLTDINIFNIDDLPSTSGGELVLNIREFTALLYYIVRAVAIGILLIIFLIIGIKAALASLAEEKAKVKRMFFDWIVSTGLVILMHMIVIFIIIINESLVELIESVAESAGIDNMINSLRSSAFSFNHLLGWGCTIAYSILTVQTMAFVVIYIVRLFKVIFLIVISPIMPLTYSIDRAKAGQANALNNWLKEFTANVFIQVIHCIIYVVIISVPMSAIESVTVGSISSLTLPLILCIALMFVKKAEELLTTLFGFDKATTLTNYSSVVNHSQTAVLTGISVANGTYTVTNNMTNNANNITFGSNIKTIGQRASEGIHGLRDKAANWLVEEEQRSTPMDAEYKKLNDEKEKEKENETENEDNVKDASAYNEDSQNEDIEQKAIEAPDRGASSEEIADKVAEAVKSTKEEQNDEEHTEHIENKELETEENLEINAENLEEFFKDENFFSTDTRNEGEKARNYLNPKEKSDFIRDLENILEEYKNGKASLEDVLKRFEDSKLEPDDKLIQDLFNKFGLKMPNANNDEEKRATELTRSNLENYLISKNIISKSQNESNYRAPEVRKELISELMGGLQKYKNGEIGIDELKKMFAAYGLQADDKTISDFVNEFAPEKASDEKTDESSKDEKSHLKAIDGTGGKERIVEKESTVEKEVVNIGNIQLLRGDLNKIILNTRGQTIRNSKLLEILEADITAKGDYSKKGLIKFNNEIITKSGTGAFSKSNLQAAEEAVRREGDIAMRRLENFRREQTEANARMLTSAGRELAVLEIQAQQAGLFVSEASMQTANSITESRGQPQLISNQTVNTGEDYVDNTPITGQSSNVINDLNRNNKRYA